MKYCMEQSKIDPSTILLNTDGTFLVPSETKKDIMYLVDMKERYCSCHKGKLKGPCKHKKLVSEHFEIECFDVIPSKNPRMRQAFMYLGTGRKMDMDWFLGLQDVAQPIPPNQLNSSFKEANLTVLPDETLPTNFDGTDIDLNSFAYGDDAGSKDKDSRKVTCTPKVKTSPANEVRGNDESM